MTRFTPAWHGAFDKETIASIPTEKEKERGFPVFAQALRDAHLKKVAAETHKQKKEIKS